MVWWLEATDPAGPGPFYLTAPGTYSVGRKDCTIVIQADKSISRLHAEISVESAPALQPEEKDPDNLPRCKLFLKDHSKFGTFLNKDTDSRPLNSLPDGGAVLKEKDTITFGLNKAVFRLNYVPTVLCMPSSMVLNAEVRRKAEAVGAYVFEEWNGHCTHLLVEETSPVTDLVITAVLSRKPVVLQEWLQALMSQSSPQDQLPSLSSFWGTTLSEYNLMNPLRRNIRLAGDYLEGGKLFSSLRYMPTLKISSRGVALPILMAEPLTREWTLGGFTIFLQKGSLYRTHNLPALVSAAGGVVKLFTQDNLKDVAGLVQQNGLLVFPDEQAPKDRLGKKVLNSVQHLHPTSEGNLLKSILSAKLDLSTVSLSPAASVDTDETVDEGGMEVEDDAATSLPQERVQTVSLRLDPQTFADKAVDNAGSGQPKPVFQTSSMKQPQLVESEKSIVWSSTRGNTREDPPKPSVDTLTKQRVLLSSAERPAMTLPKIEEGPVLRDKVKAEIIFDSRLITRRDHRETAAHAGNAAVPNFKRFKKGVAASGNSFSALVPFAKDPYRESSYRQEMEDYVKQEKKRKEAESRDEDLFNAEKLKRRRVTAVKEARESLSIAS